MAVVAERQPDFHVDKPKAPSNERLRELLTLASSVPSRAEHFEDLQVVHEYIVRNLLADITDESIEYYELLRDTYESYGDLYAAQGKPLREIECELKVDATKQELWQTEVARLYEAMES